MKALVTGATGLIGSRLLADLQRPVVLSRNPQAAERRLAGMGAAVFPWDSTAEPPPAAAFDGVDVVIHLAGESVGDGRWTAAKKQRIRSSRVDGTRQLVETMARLPRPPAVLISGSAIGYYGSRGDELLDESAAPGSDFLAEVCAAWEHEARQAEALGTRVVTLRTGIVLSPKGGALGKMRSPFKMGIGGRLGSGRQWMSWIHLDDMAGLILHAIAHSQLKGPMNLVSPQPVTNRQFTRELAQALHRPAVLPAPAFALRLAIGEFADVLFSSQRVVPKVAEQSGYKFHFPELGEALRHLLG